MFKGYETRPEAQFTETVEEAPDLHNTFSKLLQTTLPQRQISSTGLFKN